MRSHKIETGIKWDKVPEVMENEDWEFPDDGTTDTQYRRTYIGDHMSLSPSGKMYMPWATSNLDLCPECDGSGQLHHGTRPRDRSKARNRLAKDKRKTERMIANNERIGRAHAIAQWPRRQRWHRIADGETCWRCGGYGSHEAWDDECHRELLDKEAEQHDYFIDHGDDGQIYIAESRPNPGDNEEEGYPTEPDTDDYVTTDYVTFYAFGHTNKVLVVCTPNERWETTVKIHMAEQGHFPNVWYQGERGDWNLLDPETGNFLAE